MTGQPYYDMVSIQVIDSNTIEETDKRGGKTVSVTIMVLGDGNTLHFDFTDSSNTNADPVTGVGMTVSADGKTLNLAIRDLEHGTTNRVSATKQ